MWSTYLNKIIVMMWRILIIFANQNCKSDLNSCKWNRSTAHYFPLSLLVTRDFPSPCSSRATSPLAARHARLPLSLLITRCSSLYQFSCFNKQVSITGAFTEKWIFSKFAIFIIEEKTNIHIDKSVYIISCLTIFLILFLKKIR